MWVWFYHIAMTDTFNRYLEVNPDTRKKSDRPEWCYVQYSNSYHPLHAYEVEFQWMVATSSLLNEMVSQLFKKYEVEGPCYSARGLYGDGC